MAGHLLKFQARLRSAPFMQQICCVTNRSKIGNREVVGWGINGEYSYIDSVTVPLPAIRYKETTPDVEAVRQKEKGDWKQLSIEEKKLLYRSSFCQTYAEMLAPNGEWKSVVGCALFGIALSFWMYIWVKTFVYKEYPESFSLENRQAQLKRMIDLRMNPVEGISSEWDYEKNEWKK